MEKHASPKQLPNCAGKHITKPREKKDQEPASSCDGESCDPGRTACLIRQSYVLQQGRKSGVSMETLVIRIGIHKSDGSVPFLVGFLQPFQGLLLIAYSRVGTRQLQGSRPPMLLRPQCSLKTLLPVAVWATSAKCFKKFSRHRRRLFGTCAAQQCASLHLFYGSLILPDLSQSGSKKEVRKWECRIQVDRVLQLLN